MELLPLPGSKCSLNCGAHKDHSISLTDLGSHQLGLDHINEKLLDLVLGDLDTGLNFLEGDLAPVLRQLHEGQKLHLPYIVLVLQSEPLNKTFVALIELVIGF